MEKSSYPLPSGSSGGSRVVVTVVLGGSAVVSTEVGPLVVEVSDGLFVVVSSVG